MREIKFRAWYSLIKEIVKVECVDWYKDSLRWTNEKGEEDFDSIESFDLMQYTGLLDKNGKEIYEGDICQTNDKGSIIKEYIKGWIEFHCGRLMWTDGGGHWDLIPFEEQNIEDIKSVDDLKVIGNIYENKELKP